MKNLNLFLIFILASLTSFSAYGSGSVTRKSLCVKLCDPYSYQSQLEKASFIKENLKACRLLQNMSLDLSGQDFAMRFDHMAEMERKVLTQCELIEKIYQSKKKSSPLKSEVKK